MAWVQCPTCHVRFDSEQTRAMPFCSERCRLIDLGRWLNEEIGIPVSPEDQDEDGPEDVEEPLPPR